MKPWWARKRRLSCGHRRGRRGTLTASNKVSNLASQLKGCCDSPSMMSAVCKGCPCLEQSPILTFPVSLTSRGSRLSHESGVPTSLSSTSSGTIPTGTVGKSPGSCGGLTGNRSPFSKSGDFGDAVEDWDDVHVPVPHSENTGVVFREDVWEADISVMMGWPPLV